jgi:hypothetical protein
MVSENNQECVLQHSKALDEVRGRHQWEHVTSLFKVGDMRFLSSEILEKNLFNSVVVGTT